MKFTSKILLIICIFILIFILISEYELFNYENIETIRELLIKKGLPTPEHANIEDLKKILKNHS